jgi:hypothetical protein
LEILPEGDEKVINALAEEWKSSGGGLSCPLVPILNARILHNYAHLPLMIAIRYE